MSGQGCRDQTDQDDDPVEVQLDDDRDMIRWLRLHFWWTVNDILRRNKKAKIQTKIIQKLHKNLAILSVLLNESNLEESIMKAEIARETGDFEKEIKYGGSVSAWFASEVLLSHQ